MDQQYHFLNDSQRDHIDQLFKEGQATEAVKAAFDALAAKEHESVETLKQDQGDAEGFWARMGTHIGNAFDTARKSVGMGLTNSEQVAHLDKVIAYEKQIGGQGEYVNGLLAQRSALLAKISAEEKAAVDAGAAAKHGADQDEQILHKTGGTKKGSKDDTGALAADDRQLFQEMQLNRTMSLADEKAYWQAKRDAATAGTKEYQQAVQQLLEIKNKEAAEGKAAGNKEATQARETARKQIEAAKEAAQERISMEREVTREMQKAAAQQLQGQQDVEKATVAAAQGTFASQKSAIESAFALHQTSRQQELTQLAAANDAEYAIELAAMQKYIALLDTKSKAYAQVNAQIEKLEQTHQTTMQKIQEQAALANQQMWEKGLQPISQAFNTSINGMIQGTQTLRQSLANIGDSIVAKYAQLGIDMLVKWVATEAAKTTATAVGTGERQVIEQAAATQSKITDAATGKSQITSAAATGAAKAYQAIVGIPFVGPVLAPIAAGVAFAGIEAFSGMISSAQGGWERVPADGMMTELHKNEMVLPAPVADHVRNSMGGKGGGGMTVNLSSTDPRGFKDYLRRNPGALSDALKHANRRGHFAGVR
jgi:hypothetical protein